MIETEETELDAARTKSVADIAGCLVRLSGASKFLSLPQRRYIVPSFGCAGEERIPFPESGWRSG